MAIALREIELVMLEVVPANVKRAEKPWFPRGGFLVGRLISEIRGQNRIEEIASIAKKLSIYEGILPDPLNRARRLNTARLIAQTETTPPRI